MDQQQTTLPLTAIQIGERHRKSLGDLTALAASIATVGLLHPVAVEQTDAMCSHCGHQLWLDLPTGRKCAMCGTLTRCE